jgi:peptide/nickel transport system substrate-binding protein
MWLWVPLSWRWNCSRRAGAEIGCVLRIHHRDSPASTSVHEEGTIGVIMPMMGVFNNLVVPTRTYRRTAMPRSCPIWRRAGLERGPHRTDVQAGAASRHDGKPFTAEDVRCTFDLLTNQGWEKLRLNYRESWWVTQGDDRKWRPGGNAASEEAATGCLALLASGDTPIYPYHAGAMRQHPSARVRSSLSTISRTRALSSPRTRSTGSQADPISTGSNTRSSRTARPRSSPSSPVSST